MAVFLSLIVSLAFISTIHSSQPPLDGPYKCTLKEVKIGGFKAGGSQNAYLMYPDDALDKKETFPFVAFAHGMTDGGKSTYSSYSKLWNSVCSRGFIIAGPMSCPSLYCQSFWEDVVTTIKECMSKGKAIDPVLEYANFSRTGVYGHSMGGAATVHVSDEKGLNLVAGVPLHPSVSDDFGGNGESRAVAIPLLYFTGSSDDIVPPGEVLTSYNLDPTAPKIYAEIKGANHHECSYGPNREDAYVGLYFNCWLKRDSESCAYFYDRTNKDGLCSNGGPIMTRCLVNGTAPAF